MTPATTRRCLLWTVPNGASAGNMLRTGVLAAVLDGAPDAHVVLMSPLAADAAFTREFANPRVTFEILSAHVPSGVEARLASMVQAYYLQICKTETLRIKLAARHPGTPLRYRRTKALLGRLAAPGGRRGEWYQLSDRLVRHPAIERVFDRYKPSLVATASPGLIFADIPILRTARRRGVRSIAVDLSWDNLTNKLFPLRKVDRLVVWNASMRREANALHGYDLDSIVVAGSPQFDPYFNGEPRSSRADFCRRIGLDPSRKLVTLTTMPAEAYPRHDIIVDHVLEAMRSGAVREPIDLLVRIHPRDDARKYARYAGTPHLRIEKPFRVTEARSADGMGVDVTAENTRHLADTMYHTDVNLNVASTIAIEASVFDTPVISIAFDQDDAQARPFLTSPLRYYSYTHYQQIVRTGAVRMAHSPGEMIGLLNRYLADPTLDAEGRRRVVQEQCEFTDGRSAERVARAILHELIGGVSARRAEPPLAVARAAGR
jgi:hypothetical protein